MADKRKNVDLQGFLDACCVAYNEGGDLKTVAHKTGMTFDTAYQRYTKTKREFAKRGVTLPPLDTRKTRNYKPDLDTIAAKFKQQFVEMGIPQPVPTEPKNVA